MPEPHDLQPNDPDSTAPNDATPDDVIAVTDSHNEQALTFEDLTLAQLMQEFWHAPIDTWRIISEIAQTPRESDHVTYVPLAMHTPHTPHPTNTQTSTIPIWQRASRQQIQLGLYIFAVVIALFGSRLLLGQAGIKRTEENALSAGAPYLWIAFFTWLGAELFGQWQSLVTWWHQSERLTRTRWLLRALPVFIWLNALLRFTDAMTAPQEFTLGLVQVGLGYLALGVLLWVLIEALTLTVHITARHKPEIVQGWVTPENIPSVIDSPQALMPNLRHISIFRVILLMMAVLSSMIVWVGTPNNTFPPPIIALWVINAGLWAFVFAPLNWSIFDWMTAKIDTLRRFHISPYRGYVVAFVLIMMLGVGFRFAQLDSLPPEMTSDHVEKILDANRVYNGEYNIFFANNGGREPIQMYLMSLFSNIPGLGFNHFTLKLLAAIQSLITLPLLLWLGIELMGRGRIRFGIVIGLLLSALVAVSYWHVAISRQALRIVMTPIFTSLLLIYLARAMRHNRRSDFIKAALVLGFGLYAYQAVRMLPVVVVAGIVIAIMVRNISWRERVRYGVNLAVLVFISLMVFLPMLHYSSEDPGHFWRRTAGRLLGDDVITEQLDNGTIIERQATIDEQAAAFTANVPILMTNIRNALLMFNWKGDVGWISGVPNAPAMDTYTGAFLILGLAGWLALMIRSRDPVIWLMPVMVFIMLLPSALSIAYPLENPSHTRTSGTIPPIYLIAAFPIAVLAFRFVAILPKRFGTILAVAFVSIVVLFANAQNTDRYFNEYPAFYIESSYPYSEAGQRLRGFAESDGSYGNAFMIAYPHWWGHRAIGIASGEPWWPNGIISLADVPNFLGNAQLRQDQFKLDANKDLLFFYSVDDEATSQQLKTWFPDGREQTIQSYQPDDSYMLYRVPFLGETQFNEFVANNR